MASLIAVGAIASRKEISMFLTHPPTRMLFSEGAPDPIKGSPPPLDCPVAGERLHESMAEWKPGAVMLGWLDGRVSP